MKIEGAYTVKAPPDRVYQALTDPAILSRCMPGCERLDITEENHYDIALSVGVGAIKGRYSGKIRLEEIAPPSHYRMVVDIQGKMGFVKGEGAVDLTPQEEGTVIAYAGDVQVGGPVAAVGQRMLQGTARMMVRQVFGAVEAEAVALPGTEVKHGVVRDLLRTIRREG
jgi:carbon monoxide dehydrogenase subunit G